MYEEMGISRIAENLLILFGLVPFMLFTWWGFVRLINKSTGFKLREIYERIYSDPLAAAILRVGVMACAAYLVGQAYGRIV
jgi:hypothetical protein